ncbi:hypothetical protein BOTBODRAFT_298101 [Botryobasidium botryosum FD-172 SS1]|uniref:Uncharacterized protein n=1 Tax=Botryobasidium botryosum (strain FD-172 SS1) TaxID=930990 RepID=A0A067MUW2_BOTB1|nr:hypothetical protein BOTBODRAFT_298101 [Botryobasidium botryosum FD-172 SS1]
MHPSHACHFSIPFIFPTFLFTISPPVFSHCTTVSWWCPPHPARLGSISLFLHSSLPLPHSHSHPPPSPRVSPPPYTMFHLPPPASHVPPVSSECSDCFCTAVYA